MFLKTILRIETDLWLIQVRDYRKCSPDQGSAMAAADGCPVINKVCLRLSLENVVKDIPMISNNSWTYGDLMVNFRLYTTCGQK